MTPAPTDHQDAPPVLGIIVPCYNEEAILPLTIAALTETLDRLTHDAAIDERSFLLLVDDGSEDGTWEVIAAPGRNARVRGIHLAFNAGHQQALYAGMMHVRDEVDCLVTLDADLQDDPEVIPDMLQAHAQGARVVYGIRSSRESDTAFKRLSARLFYALCRLIGLRLKPQHADFRLLGRPVLDALARYDERLLFLRGIIPTLGFSSAEVYYVRKPRFRGATHYSLARMLNLAVDGITSFSVAPLRMIGMAGALALVFSAAYLVYVLYQTFRGITVQGWSSIIVITIFFGAIQLISISILGEYIGKIYIESKKRPRYFIDNELK